eukprot:scaffold52612_cov25-Tisochrysis_lutea.AAC.2
MSEMYSSAMQCEATTLKMKNNHMELIRHKCLLKRSTKAPMAKSLRAYKQHNVALVQQLLTHISFHFLTDTLWLQTRAGSALSMRLHTHTHTHTRAHASPSSEHTEMQLKAHACTGSSAHMLLPPVRSRMRRRSWRPCSSAHMFKMYSSCTYAARTCAFSQEEMQFEMYRCTKSVGRSTAVVRRLTTSMLCRLMHEAISTRLLDAINTAR